MTPNSPITPSTRADSGDQSSRSVLQDKLRNNQILSRNYTFGEEQKTEQKYFIYDFTLAGDPPPPVLLQDKYKALKFKLKENVPRGINFT